MSRCSKTDQGQNSPSQTLQQNVEARNLQTQLPSTLQHSMELSQEKGASSWLSLLPIDNHGFALHKSAFRDALSLRYGWSLQNPPSHCTCGYPFSIDHALTCKTGGFPAIRHNEVRDITASLLSEVCHGVTIEPHLQPLTGEVMSHNTAVTEDGARLDVAMYGFWGGRFEKAFVDVRVFNPCAQSNRRSPLASVYRRHQEKKRHYEERVREVERATFTPLVMSTTGGMGRAATTFYKRLASMISEKQNTHYTQTINWIRCKLSFALLRASIMSIRGARSSRHHAASEAALGPIDLLRVKFNEPFFNFNFTKFPFFLSFSYAPFCVPAMHNVLSSVLSEIKCTRRKQKRKKKDFARARGQRPPFTRMLWRRSVSAHDLP